MRCDRCGWVVGDKRCPCGASAPKYGTALVPTGTRVVARPGRGPSMIIWMTGEVVGHQGPLHQVRTRMGEYWCESDDLVPESPERDQALQDGTRVWALWLDGRWYPGMIDGCQGRLRHVTWDDGDTMWVEAYQTVVQATGPEPPSVGSVVVARRWDGQYQPARVDQRDGPRFHVVFADGEESWVPGDDLYTFPPSPFHD